MFSCSRFDIIICREYCFILGMLTDNDKLSAIINKVITACSIGEIIATICDVCEGSLDGKWF